MAAGTDRYDRFMRMYAVKATKGAAMAATESHRETTGHQRVRIEEVDR